MTSQNSRANAKKHAKGMHDYNMVPAVRIFAANDSEFAEKDNKAQEKQRKFRFLSKF
jgi:hypothetical protein